MVSTEGIDPEGPPPLAYRRGRSPFRASPADRREEAILADLVDDAARGQTVAACVEPVPAGSPA